MTIAHPKLSGNDVKSLYNVNYKSPSVHLTIISKLEFQAQLVLPFNIYIYPIIGRIDHYPAAVSHL